MLAGSLQEFTIPDIFTLLASTRKTGVLNLASPQTRGRVWIVSGDLTYAVADVTRAPLAARLLHGGEIEADDLESLVRAQATGSGSPMSAALNGLGIDHDRSSTLLHDQIVDALFDLARCGQGDFSFEPGVEIGQSGPTFASAEVMATVNERLAEWEGIVAQLPSSDSVLTPVSRPAGTLGAAIQIQPDQWEVFTLVDGSRSVADIIQLTGQGHFVVGKLLSSLVSASLLTVREDVTVEPLSQQRARRLAQVEHEVLGAITASTDDAVTAAEPPAAPAQTSGVADILQQIKVSEPAPATVDTEDGMSPPVSETSDARRERELAALGLGRANGSSSASAADIETPAPVMNGAVNADLLARLINGVRGG